MNIKDRSNVKEATLAQLKTQALDEHLELTIRLVPGQLTATIRCGSVVEYWSAGNGSILSESIEMYRDAVVDHAAYPAVQS